MDQKKREYKTRQRKSVERFFSEHHGVCFSVKQIKAILDGQGEALGEATLYRSVEKMTEEKRLNRYYTGDNIAVYCSGESGMKCMEHFHFRCTQCGGVEHADCEFFEKLTDHMFRDHNFSVDFCKTVIYGRCSKCSLKQIHLGKEK